MKRRANAMRAAVCAAALAGLALGALPARADLSQVSAAGFTSSFRAEVKASPDQLWALIVEPARWWNDAHSWSGKAANFTLEPRAGGCWCERWEAGGRSHTVEHARVLMAQPTSVLRLQGGLGPLQDLPVQAVLTFRIAVQEGRTVLALTYRVGGPAELGLDKLAAAVDGVLAQQFKGLVASAEPG